MTGPARRDELWLTLAASAALAAVLWPPVLPGIGKPVLVGEAQGGQVQSVDAYLAKHGELRNVRIAPPGLAPERWRDTAAAGVAFAPSALDDQVIHLHWPARVDLGQALQVTGRVAVSAPATVILSDPFGAQQVSADVSPQAPGFSLSLTPRAPGRYLATLRLERADGSPLDDGSIPVTVLAPTPLRVLVEASAPSFDLRELRRWAEASGTELSMRVLVAQDRFAETFINRDGPLTPTEGDLLLVDARAWTALETSRRRRIADAVDQGLGVLLLADESTQTDAWVTGPLAFPVEDGRWSVDQIELSRFSDEPLPALTPVGRPPSRKAQVLLADDEGNPLASVQAQGWGRVGWLAVRGTHRWVTAGHAAAHARLWQQLLQPVARAQAPPAIGAPPFAIRDHRTAVCASAGQDGPLTVLESEESALQTVTLGTDELGERCGYYWPRQAGWHTLRLGEHAHELYVAEEQPWPGVAAQRAQDASRRAASTSPPPDGGIPGRAPRTPFLIAFVLLAGALWWQERRRSAGQPEA